VTPEHRHFFETKFSPGLFYGFGHKKDIKELFNAFPSVRENHTDKTSALDVGFGSTSELYTLAEINPVNRLVGIDVYARRMKSIARELKDFPSISAMQGDINNLVFENDYFNFVYAFNVLYLADNLTSFCAEVCRILKRKGWFLLMNNIRAGKTGARIAGQLARAKITVHENTETEIITALNSAGFKAVQHACTSRETFILSAQKK